ncbi:MAG: hypothetical protein M3179_02080 [Actinomycetota bacterium]|nr:hypothetical protein [Actinomycetota bacterium]
MALALLPASPASAETPIFIVDGNCGKHCFDPELAFGNVGEPVKWTSFSIEVHDIRRCTLGPCPFNGGTGTDPTFVSSPEIEPSAEWSHTFTAPGSYNYYCEIHGYSVMHGTVQIAGEPQRSEPPAGDFDGDGKTDLGVFRPSAGAWFVRGSAGGTSTVPFGTTGDLAVPGNYDGDGDVDQAVFRPSNGYWFVHGGAITQFGAPGDVPVPGDYDSDGDTDIAVYRPSNGYWFVKGGAITQWGTSGDVPLPVPPAIWQEFFA